MFGRPLSPWLTTLILVAGSGCENKSGFDGTAKRSTQAKTPKGGKAESPLPNVRDEASLDPGTVNPQINADQPGSTGPDGGLTPILVFKPETVAAVGVQDLKQEADRFAWTVTQTGTVTYFKIAGDTVTSTKKWTGATPTNGGGARTYVLEGGGLVIVRTGGEAFFVDPAQPEGNLRTMGAPYFSRLAVPGRTFAGDARGCAVSYRRAGQRFVGIGIGRLGDFIEIPQLTTSPFAPDWAKATYRGGVNPKANGWGYSCYIDQQKSIYYGAWIGEPVKALNLTTGLEVDPTTTATNGTFSSTSHPAESVGPKATGQGSYAISGDNRGSVLSGAAYTMAADPVHQVIWATSRAGNQVTVFPANCLSSERVCTGHGTFMLEAGSGRGLGPVSTFGDGSVLGLSRAGYGGDNSLYLLSLKNPQNIGMGIDIKKLATLDGDPYMYTDFTGATLYLTKAEQKFDLTKVGYKPENPLVQVGFTWATRDGATPAWENIDMELRCYKKSDPAAPPPYEKVAEAIQPATKQSFISTTGCAKGRKDIDTIDLRLTQLNNATTLMQIRKVQITAYQ